MATATRSTATPSLSRYYWVEVDSTDDDVVIDHGRSESLFGEDRHAVYETREMAESAASDGQYDLHECPGYEDISLCVESSSTAPEWVAYLVTAAGEWLAVEIASDGTPQQRRSVLVAEEGGEEWILDARLLERATDAEVIAAIQSELDDVEPAAYRDDWERGDDLPEVDGVAYLGDRGPIMFSDLIVGRSEID